VAASSSNLCRREHVLAGHERGSGTLSWTPPGIGPPAAKGVSALPRRDVRHLLGDVANGVLDRVGCLLDASDDGLDDALADVLQEEPMA
jgi:hypothetical protein